MPRDNISEIKHCEFCKKEVVHLNGYCLKCQPSSYSEMREILEQQVSYFLTKLTELEQELATERESTQQALQASQEWHERQKQEIIAEWKTKLQNLIQQRKTQIQQEITLLKGVLESHD